MALFGRLGNLFGGRKAPAPKKPEAFRGVATGWSDQEFVARGRPPYARYQTFGEDEVRGFLEGEPLFVQSSNVGAIVQYHEGTDYPLVVEYHGGKDSVQAVWAYQVSRTVAEDFARAPSKGIWIWDHIRVRGKGNQHLHQVPAKKLR